MNMEWAEKAEIPDPIAAMIRRNERAAIADACAGFGLGIVVGLLLAASGVFS